MTKKGLKAAMKDSVLKEIEGIDALELKKVFLTLLAKVLKDKSTVNIVNGKPICNIGSQKEKLDSNSLMNLQNQSCFGNHKKGGDACRTCNVRNSCKAKTKPFKPADTSFSKEFIKRARKEISLTATQQKFLSDHSVAEFMNKYPKVTISRSKLVDLQYALNEVHARIPKHTSFKRADGKLRWSPEMKEFLKTKGIKEFLKKYDDIPKMKVSAMYYSMRKSKPTDLEKLGREQEQMRRWSEESKVREAPVRKCAFCLEKDAVEGGDLCAECQKIPTGQY